MMKYIVVSAKILNSGTIRYVRRVGHLMALSSHKLFNRHHVGYQPAISALCGYIIQGICPNLDTEDADEVSIGSCRSL